MNVDDQKQEIEHLMDRLQMAEETYKEKYIECEVLQSKLFKQKLGLFYFHHSLPIVADPISFSVLHSSVSFFLVLCCLHRQIHMSNGAIHRDVQLSLSTCCNRRLSSSRPVTLFLVFVCSFSLLFFPRL